MNIIRRLTEIIAVGWLITFSCSAFSFAQEIPAPEQTPHPVVTIEGRIILRQGFIALITADEKSYLLTKAKEKEEVFAQVASFADQDFDLTVTGIETGELRRFAFTDYQAKKAYAEEYRVFEVLSINEAKPGSKVSKFPIIKAQPAESPFFVELNTPSIKKISGKVKRCDFRNVLPTLELEGKPNFIIMLPTDAQVLKVVEDRLMSFKARDLIKKGTNLRIWYEEKGDLRTARIIVVDEK